jgi:hypothetical protein
MNSGIELMWQRAKLVPSRSERGPSSDLGLGPAHDNDLELNSIFMARVLQVQGRCHMTS